jgi:large subunit ribosomal protein L4
MPKVKLYNIEGKVVGEHELDAKVFGASVNPSVVHEVAVSIQANARRPWAHTKTRGNVSGGGKKPWKQKGTGRARQGSIRSPQWVGGGIVFGPLNERNYTKKINRKLKSAALAMVLSDKVASEKLVLVDAFSSKGKTKESVTALSKLPVNGKISLVTTGSDPMLVRSLRNVEKVNVTNLSSLNLFDVLDAQFVVMTADAAATLGKGKQA